MLEHNGRLPPDPYHRLTTREHEVLERVAQGDSNKEIARHLGITFATAKTYVGDILQKVGARTRTEAACEWMKRHHL